MPDPERVVDALLAGRERREPAMLLDGAQLVAPARQDLVRVGLMSDVPDQSIVRRVEHIMQRNRQFDGAEAGGEMAAHLAHRVDEIPAKFVGQIPELWPGDFSQVRGGLDLRKQWKIVFEAFHYKEIKQCLFKIQKQSDKNK